MSRGTMRVNAVQRFCLRDGPGIRTTVFLQGCPLRCWWCQNPETRPEESDQAREVDATGLARELERDARYWRASGGGVTVSGGEPLLQAGGVGALLRELGERNHHRAVDTSGAVEPDAVRAVSRMVDLWLWDVKTVDEERFRKSTGGCVRRPLENLELLLRETTTPVVVRIPLVRGFNDDGEAERVVRRLSRLPRPVAVEVLRGHDLSRGKRTCSPGSRSAAVGRARAEEVRRAAREAGLALAGDGERAER